MTQYRVILAYGPWSVGHIFTDMPGNVGRTLKARGLVDEVRDEETKGMKSPLNRMMKPRVTRGMRNEE